MKAISLQELAVKHKEHVKILCYPSGNLDGCMDRLDELKSLGISSLIFFEERNSIAPFIVGKGFRSIVLLGKSDESLYALKIRRSDSPVKSMEREARMLMPSSSFWIGPCIYRYTNNIIVMDYVQGPTIERWVRSLTPSDAPSLKLVIRRCLDVCFKLDSIGLDHGELSDASDHIIIANDLMPVIIDFSNASVDRGVSNVTSFLSYITYGRVAADIRKILGEIKISREELRMYKRGISKDCYDALISAMGL